jgi:hypothetical protein
VPPDTLVPAPRLVPRFLTLQAQTPGTCGVLVRRSEALAVGGFEPRFRGMYEDQVFIYKLCLNASVYVESGSWDRYRQHPHSHASLARAGGDDQKRGGAPSYAAFLEWLADYVEARGIDDPEVRRALDAQRAGQRRAPAVGLGRLAGAARGAVGRLARSGRAGTARR